MGTYQCICDEGYRQVDSGSSCEDVDECSLNNGGCDDLCINSPGSYSCGCSTGYMLLYDGQSCSDIDECTGLDNVCNGGECQNTPGGYSCVCSGGLMMGPDATSCLDLDECIIDPEVSGLFRFHVKYIRSCFRFAKMENVKTCWDLLNASVTMVFQCKTKLRMDVLMMTNALLICSIVIHLLSAKTQMGLMTVFVERGSQEMDLTVRYQTSLL